MLLALQLFETAVSVELKKDCCKFTLFLPVFPIEFDLLRKKNLEEREAIRTLSIICKLTVSVYVSHLKQYLKTVRHKSGVWAQTWWGFVISTLPRDTSCCLQVTTKQQRSISLI